ncbi:MipA/OmpV family protein [Croceicoccus marinus]|uniref:MltA-interacting MipA n=1 Tax=Croceicoccus marinus TaxID=450378 RepID=A0A1Z1FDK1_9SPHN|nr:MipA/OmpV family protein [Croceicoccus marinus]ARU16825.1 MltA-interacting MipA [Croceicoccus marinus]
MTRNSALAAGAALLASAALAAPAAGQEILAPEVRGRPVEEPDEWVVSLRGAALLTPSWLGSNDMSLSLVPDVRVQYGDKFFASIPEGVGWNAIRGDGWKIGPLAKIRFGRSEENGGSPFQIFGRSNDLRGMGDVNASAEIGGFAEKRFGSDGQWEARAEVLKGFGGHDGVVAYTSLDYRKRLGLASLRVGPRLNLVSGDFNDTFFGIDEAQSAGTGLPVYDADGGVLSWGAGASLVQPLSRRSAISAFGNVEYLGSEPGNSPLIEERGQRLQMSVGVGYGYRFNL